MAEIIRIPQIYRIAYTSGEGEEYVSDGYGKQWETRKLPEAEDYMIWLSENWAGYLFWIVEGR